MGYKDGKKKKNKEKKNQKIKEGKKEKKDQDFHGFMINNDLLRKANKEAIVLHCLPAYRNKEITDEVIEGKKSRIFEQAENRLHSQQALLACILA